MRKDEKKKLKIKKKKKSVHKYQIAIKTTNSYIKLRLKQQTRI